MAKTWIFQMDGLSTGGSWTYQYKSYCNVKGGGGFGNEEYFEKGIANTFLIMYML